MLSSSAPGRVLQVIIVVGAIGLSLGACGDQQSSTDVRVENPRLVQTPSGERSFVGTLVNDRSRSLSIVQIEVALYDDEGSPVETIRLEVKDVAAQDSVEFSETIDSDRPFQQAQVQSVLTP